MHVNGKFYHNPGQGYAMEKAKGGVKTEPEAADANTSGAGDEMTVTHMGGGRFKTRSKHRDGKETSEQHDSPEEMHAHMAQHFGTGESDDSSAEDTSDDDMSEGSEDALGSILG